MGETSAYCSDCYNKTARTEDAQVKAEERVGQVPMSKQGTRSKCGKARASSITQRERATRA